MDIAEQEAFILHTRPLRDNQRIVELLTKHSGKVSAVVYIGKTQKSNKKGLLQPFLPLQVLLKGKSQLKNLSRIETTQRSYPLKGDSVFSGFYLNELLVRLLGEHVECPELFHQYKQSLEALSSDKPIEKILRQFEMALLDELGQSFDFTDVMEHEEAYFYYIPEEGFVPAVSKMTLPLYRREHILLIAQDLIEDKQVLRTFKLLMRQVINYLLDGKPLNSRKLFTR